jgi:hypothetical protein
MSSQFTKPEREYLWKNTKGFFYLFLAEAALMLGALVATLAIRPFWAPLAGLLVLCAVAGGTFFLYNLHVDHLAVNILNQRKNTRHGNPQAQNTQDRPSNLFSSRV